MRMNVLVSILFVFLFLNFQSCGQIKAEEISGIWNIQDESGPMQIEIMPQEGKFHAYLLFYYDGEHKMLGTKEEEFIIISDLVFEENGLYTQGRFYLDAADAYSELELRMLDENQIEATYTYQGQEVKSNWFRNGFALKANEIENAVEADEESLSKLEKDSSEVSYVDVQQTANNSKDPKTKPQENTRSRKAFNVVGYQEVVPYGDKRALTKVIKNLWTKLYEEDFSNQLSNISGTENIYVLYGSYDQPKGKMSITIGYQVADLENTPAKLKGVKIPKNEFYVFPLSGEASDYEGEAWGQLEELMAYRQNTSVDFEVYTLDANYEIVAAEMWVASK